MEHALTPYTALVPRTDKLVVQKVGYTALVTIDNPPANTWDTDTLHGLVELIEHLDDDPEVYALVITGRGRRFFSAGADLRMFAEGDKAQARTIARLFGQAFEALRDFAGVSIAAINGYAMGGGLECALACDIRIAEREAQLGLPEASVGLLPCAGGTQALAWLVGEGWAKRMILCGERIDGVKAERIGLVEEVVEEGQALTTALRLAAQVGRQSPQAVKHSKQLIQSGRNRPINSLLSEERERFVDLFDLDDTTEGVAAFLQKRPPQWRNR
ncbi:short chain enoyl-CoA hydratase [Halopseudomonas xinjiangensis]|uniref:Short chain enoyl-CoA hydratase n=1 Tax=Halopseudomonas xinjiangensis TaxID=487184 RepID=A0A1H1V8A6_9GAMM|nr:enoyl-CoA hydratase [Halopseudomonas xinjiangensis]SDS80968.1 short chain enoyl-CoA hydratase [Halopseudomonas xinjiangensis]